VDAPEMPGGKHRKPRRIYIRDAGWSANRVTVIAPEILVASPTAARSSI
jgi:hypothetical protein